MDPDGAGGFRSAGDGGDAARDYADIKGVAVDFPEQPHWRLALGGAPPSAAPAEGTVVSYGVTFETTGDDAPDIVVGISNDGSAPGDYRVWVTDLATGATEEQDGPPYGFPVEFAHPGERQPGDPGELEMVFTFRGGSLPPAVSVRTRFYAWASVEEDGTVVAWDYAPDAGWVGAPADAAASDEAHGDDGAAPAAAVHPDAPAGVPECQAKEFDFIGEGTLRGLGLHTATPVEPPDIDRVARIWVTRDLIEQEIGPPGGPVRTTRMLCFEFADGSGGSGWPVDPAWRPPADAAVASDLSEPGGPSPGLLAVGLVAAMMLAVSALAFRGRR